MNFDTQIAAINESLDQLPRTYPIKHIRNLGPYYTQRIYNDTRATTLGGVANALMNSRHPGGQRSHTLRLTERIRPVIESICRRKNEHVNGCKHKYLVRRVNPGCALTLMAILMKYYQDRVLTAASVRNAMKTLFQQLYVRKRTSKQAVCPCLPANEECTNHGCRISAAGRCVQ